MRPNPCILDIDGGGQSETIDALGEVLVGGYKKIRTEQCNQYYRRESYDNAERVRYREEALELMKNL